MSATIPPQLEGTHAPNPIELVWERYRKLIWVVILAVFAALGVRYGWRYYNQLETDRKWGPAFATSLGLDSAYIDKDSRQQSLSARIANMKLNELEQGLASAEPAQKPYYLLAIARKATLAGEWERAESALAQLEKQFPEHPLVTQSGYPVQVRDDVKPDPKAPPPAPNKKPEYKPAVAGSAVSLMRQQIAAAKEYQRPQQFEKPALPTGGPRVKFDLGDYGSFVIQLLTDAAPAHVAKFLELAKAEHWKGIAVDEIHRPGAGPFQRNTPVQVHLGFESTRAAARAEWNTTEPSTHAVEFEKNALSHFAGAVSARNEASGKSAPDRIWIAGTDASQFDGERVIFGFVVEGLDTITKVAEGAMSAQEEEMGRGRPSENIRVTAVTVLE